MARAAGTRLHLRLRGEPPAARPGRCWRCRGRGLRARGRPRRRRCRYRIEAREQSLVPRRQVVGEHVEHGPGRLLHPSAEHDHRGLGQHRDSARRTGTHPCRHALGRGEAVRRITTVERGRRRDRRRDEPRDPALSIQLQHRRPTPTRSTPGSQSRCAPGSRARASSSPRTPPGRSGPPGPSRKTTSTRSTRITPSGGDDNVWSTPAAMPFPEADVADDDISSIIAFTVPGGDRIGVFWSNQDDVKDYFAWQPDGGADNDWTIETALAAGTGMQAPADDHMNLKTDSSGRVYAVVKTSNSGSQPLILLLARAAAGGWTTHVVGLNANSNTRPILEVDATTSTLHVFMTGPLNGNGSGQEGGEIVEKTSPTTPISFPTGDGTVVIRDDDSGDMNNATSTKQNITSSSGIVVLAYNDTTLRYWHHHESGTGPPDPAANFTGAPTSGTWPLAVTFTNTSTGTGTLTYAWNFGDRLAAARPRQEPGPHLQHRRAVRRDVDRHRRRRERHPGQVELHQRDGPDDAGRELHRFAEVRHVAADGHLRQHLDRDRAPDLCVGLRRRRHVHRIRAEPHLQPGCLHREADGHQRGRQQRDDEDGLHRGLGAARLAVLPADPDPGPRQPQQCRTQRGVPRQYAPELRRRRRHAGPDRRRRGHRQPDRHRPDQGRLRGPGTGGRRDDLIAQLPEGRHAGQRGDGRARGGRPAQRHLRGHGRCHHPAHLRRDRLLHHQRRWLAVPRPGPDAGPRQPAAMSDSTACSRPT